MAGQAHRRDEAGLKDYGEVVASFRNAVMAGEHGLDQVPGFIKKILVSGAWRERIERGKTLTNETFLEFITDKPMKGCAFKPEQVETLIRHDPETLAMWRKAVTPAKGTNQHSDNVTTLTDGRGNSRSYTLDRLDRERPDLFERVVDGELSANAAAIEAGFRKKLTPFQQVKRLWPKLSEAEKDEIRELP